MDSQLGTEEDGNDPTSDNSDAISIPEIECSGMFGYAVGHFYNDLCASMWFTYLMIFLERVIHFRASVAGFLMLVGQVTDAVSTLFVGIASDSFCLPFFFKNFGRRISWHLIGTIFVTLSFPFIFNNSLLSVNAADIWKICWYSSFIVIFQFGWAAVQISHLALIPELCTDSSFRNTLGSLRYFNIEFDILISSFVVVGVGIITSLLFYLTTKEPNNIRTLSRLNSLSSTASELVKMSYKKWFCHLQFYQIALLYMFSRLYINISQVYFPFYITMAVNLSKKYIAVLPMISYIFSFIISTIVGIPVVNKFVGNKVLYFFGCLLGIAGCVVMYMDRTMVSVFFATVLIGLAQGVVLVSVLAVTADMINKNTESGAFVYGAMSFLDKLANGIAYQVLELINPGCNTSVADEKCNSFYSNVISLVPAGCLTLSLLILLTLSKQNIGVRHRNISTHTGFFLK
uniref:Major facilitator superfamily domain-containing protein 12 n=1 Tax=Syphacia muris TaxID=451379 RepID=A0A0N5APS2_9BILA